VWLGFGGVDVAHADGPVEAGVADVELLAEAPPGGLAALLWLGALGFGVALQRVAGGDVAGRLAGWIVVGRSVHCRQERARVDAVAHGAGEWSGVFTGMSNTINDKEGRTVILLHVDTACTLIDQIDQSRSRLEKAIEPVLIPVSDKMAVEGKLAAAEPDHSPVVYALRVQATKLANLLEYFKRLESRIEV
jgi:hypothetical protein